MDLGAFSISLAVEDLERSRSFYEKLGFSVSGGDGETWQILRNGTAIVGLFQGLFDGNILTFNPGYDQQAEEVGIVDDVRVIQARLEEEGIELIERVDSKEGAGHITLVDPDGNAILIDQFR